MKRILLALLCSFVTIVAVAQEQPLDLGGIPTTPAAPTAPAVASAPSVAAPESVAKKEKSSSSFFDLVVAGGWIGYIIILLSLVAVALMIEFALTIRESVFAPKQFAEKVLQQLLQGQFVPSLQLCKSEPSVLGQVLHAGMSEYELGWNAVETKTEEAIAGHAARLYRKVEYLNVIGNIAPMLGLLGTVVGMVYAFQELADSDGYARAADLAKGIYLALVTTVQGLIVAIPALAAYSYFNNRVAKTIAETTFVAEQVLQPIKRGLMKKGK